MDPGRKISLTVDLHLEPQPPKIGCGHVIDNFKSKDEDKFDLPTISLLLQGHNINTHNNQTVNSIDYEKNSKWVL